MQPSPEHITWATALRLSANLLTAITAVAWLRFADCRDGVLSSPNLHHRVYLRVLISLSCAAFVATLLSLAFTVHVSTDFSTHANFKNAAKNGTQRNAVAAVPAAPDVPQTAAGDAPGVERR